MQAMNDSGKNYTAGALKILTKLLIVTVGTAFRLRKTRVLDSSIAGVLSLQLNKKSVNWLYVRSAQQKFDPFGTEK
ncbi:MAG: hypothetical protein ACU83V_05010 [Gammaproteobacteria bacterium]